MDHLQLFYEQAIPKVGWEKYKIINVVECLSREFVAIAIYCIYLSVVCDIERSKQVLVAI